MGVKAEYGCETKIFLDACQVRGIEIVPVDDIVEWLQSFPRTKRGEPLVFLNSSLSVLTDKGSISVFKKNHPRSVR